MRRRMVLMMLAAAGLCALGARRAAALEPGEVAIVFNTRSVNSQALARFYMNARKIPPGNLIPIICSVGEDMSEEEYRKTVVPQVKKALAERKGDVTIKCLVTTYDVPLKIGPAVQDLASRQEANTYKVQLEGIFDEIEQEARAYDRIAAATEPATMPGAATKPATQPTGNGVKRTLEEELVKLKASAAGAGGRIGKLEASERGPALQALAQAEERVAGISGVAMMLESAGANEESRAQAAQLRRKLADIEKQVAELTKGGNNAAGRKELAALRLVSHGLVGEAKQVEEIINYLEPIETESCFDNELALALADQSYPRGRWVINPKNLDFYPTTRRMSDVPRTMLVTRLDGATVGAAQEMITEGLKVEKKGLDGTLYLDARGLHEGPYAVFDEQLRAAAKWLKANSTLPVVFDDKPELLQAKDCPNAALYCGWYSVHNYQDSCQWTKGGVGYHVASWEMTTLHNPQDLGWVPNLLKRGYCGTLGPTNEPYLSSFPNPAYFFPLLECGEFTQGEVWEVTAPMLSWRTGYVGDPLYNPFKAKPRVKLESIKGDAVLRNAFLILRPEAKAGGVDAAPMPGKSASLPAATLPGAGR